LANEDYSGGKQRNVRKKDAARHHGDSLGLAERVPEEVTARASFPGWLGHLEGERIITAISCSNVLGSLKHECKVPESHPQEIIQGGKQSP